MVKTWARWAGISNNRRWENIVAFLMAAGARAGDPAGDIIQRT